jgi:hypothetical protein
VLNHVVSLSQDVAFVAPELRSSVLKPYLTKEKKHETLIHCIKSTNH